MAGWEEPKCFAGVDFIHRKATTMDAPTMVPGQNFRDAILDTSNMSGNKKPNSFRPLGKGMNS